MLRNRIDKTPTPIDQSRRVWQQNQPAGLVRATIFDGKISPLAIFALEHIAQQRRCLGRRIWRRVVLPRRRASLGARQRGLPALSRSASASRTQRPARCLSARMRLVEARSDVHG
jgi:hypothetical protein